MHDYQFNRRGHYDWDVDIRMISQSDLNYIAGAVIPGDKIEQRTASFDAGFLGFDFCGPRPETLSPQKLWELNRVNRDNDFFARKSDEWKRNLPFASREKLIREAAAQAESHRLVQGRKSPTSAEAQSYPHHPQRDQLARIEAQRDYLARRVTLDSTESFFNHDILQPIEDAPAIDDRRSKVRLMHRDWSGQYRVLYTTQTQPGDAPDPQDGDRYTEKLTQRAVSKIFESGAYVATCYEGFTTFLTLTFTKEQRNEIFEGRTTIGREVSRFLDGAKKLYKRGFKARYVTKKDPETKKAFCPLPNVTKEIAPNSDDFHYIWVAECPANEDGEPNPHVHVLLKWQVEPDVFNAWAERIEKIWGNGFAKLERIKHPKAAGSYIIKAVGYAAKGANADQGLIKGNRYNIARCSRAPGWDCLLSFEADNMAAIIKEMGYKLEQWRKPLERKLARLQRQHKEAIRAKAVAKNANKPEEVKKKLAAKLARLENAMKSTREEMKSRGVHATTKNIFCLSFDGDEAESKAHDFLVWAAGARGWGMRPASGTDSEIKEIKQFADQYYAGTYTAFTERRCYWKALLSETPPSEPDENELAFWRETLDQYERINHAA
ncbi:rolling circle replication-associated protein [Photobacterium salinisoli]|uniref:rolling circle replication-associated protein n=1 Tax=Photobacterium salinisoli TaxID=1616783 RepID=UPI001F091ED8|nr:hypothetical protein [Photobacterium salinisoli]